MLLDVNVEAPRKKRAKSGRGRTMGVLAGGRSLEEETSPSSHSLLVEEVDETSFGDDIPVESTLGSLIFCCLLREG